MKRKSDIILHMFFWVLTSLPLPGVGEPAQWELTILANQWVKGEPIVVHIWKEGMPWDGVWTLDGKRCRPQGVPEIKIPPHDKVKSPHKEHYPREEETFPLQRECDWSVKDMVTGFHQLCYERQHKKKCADFQIVEPGINDQEIYKALVERNAYDIISALVYHNPSDILNPENILKNHPTSTYAPWVLMDKLYEPAIPERGKQQRIFIPPRIFCRGSPPSKKEAEKISFLFEWFF